MPKYSPTFKELAEFLKRTTTDEYLESLSTNTKRTANRVENPQFMADVLELVPTLKDKLKTQSVGSLIVELSEHLFKTRPLVSKAVPILNAFQKWLHAIYIHSGDKGGKSITAVMKSIRNVIREHYPASSDVIKKSYTSMKYDRALWIKEQEDYRKDVFKRNQNKIVFYASDIYDIIDQCSSSDDWRMNAIGVELSIGSRINEILTLGQFKPVEGKDTWVEQVNISKQKHKTEDKQTKSVVKPIIRLSFGQLLSMINNIRTNLATDIKQIKAGKKTDAEISKKYNNQINNRVENLFAGKSSKKRVTSHNLRAVYANLSYSIYADQDKESLQVWVSKVLAHSKDSMTVASSYTTVTVKMGDIESKSSSDNTEMKIEEVRSKNDKTQSTVEDLQKQLESLQIAINSKNQICAETYVNIPTNPGLRGGKSYDFMLESIKAMQDKSLPVTRKALRELKYGSTNIARYFKEIKKK